MRLYDCASTIRSKNAGPFTLTIDPAFPNRDTYEIARTSPSLAPETVAALYHVPVASVRIWPFEQILTIKVSLPRPDDSSGAACDRDVYGCQQHFPLANLEIG